MQVFRRELDVFYGAYRSKRTLTLPKPTIQFADYAIWERNCVENGLFAHQQRYWNELLGPELRSIETDRPMHEMSFKMQRRSLDFDENLFSMVKATAQKAAISPFMLVVAALVITLHYITKQDDIRLGILIANRAQCSTEGLIGHFRNTLVLRIGVRSGMSYHEVMSQVRCKMLEAYSYSQIPFEQMARAFEKEYKAKRRGLFSVLLSYQHLPKNRPRFSELGLEPLTWRWPSRFTNITVTSFDLIVTLKELANVLVGDLNCKSTFASDTGTEIGELLKSVVTTIVSDADVLLPPWQTNEIVKPDKRKTV